MRNRGQTLQKAIRQTTELERQASGSTRWLTIMRLTVWMLIVILCCSVVKR